MALDLQIFYKITMQNWRHLSFPFLFHYSASSLQLIARLSVGSGFKTSQIQDRRLKKQADGQRSRSPIIAADQYPHAFEATSNCFPPSIPMERAGAQCPLTSRSSTRPRPLIISPKSFPSSLPSLPRACKYKNPLHLRPCFPKHQAPEAGTSIGKVSEAERSLCSRVFVSGEMEGEKKAAAGEEGEKTEVVAAAAAAAAAADVGLKELSKKLDDFAKERDWEKYHSPRNLLLAMVGEVGELSELFMWKGEVPKGLPGWGEAEKEHLGEELADVLLYLIRLSDMCGVDLGDAATRKIVKNAVKYPAPAKGA